MKRVSYILFVLVIACSKESEIIPEPNATVKYILKIGLARKKWTINWEIKQVVQEYLNLLKKTISNS